jgi:hypothetical protein
MPIQDRYPTSDILAQRGHWDDATRKVILDRVHNVPPYRYFTPHEQATMIALCNRVMPQEHRPPDRRIPIAPWLDAQCLRTVEHGFRYDNMPVTADAWRQGLTGIDQTAEALFGKAFSDLNAEQQDAVLREIRAGDPPGEVWQTLPAYRWWTRFALRGISGTYYAHPFAWDEIGFGGPAYPRGYFALNNGMPEPWEAREVEPDADTGEGRP